MCNPRYNPTAHPESWRFNGGFKIRPFEARLTIDRSSINPTLAVLVRARARASTHTRLPIIRITDGYRPRARYRYRIPLYGTDERTAVCRGRVAVGRDEPSKRKAAVVYIARPERPGNNERLGRRGNFVARACSMPHREAGAT